MQQPIKPDYLVFLDFIRKTKETSMTPSQIMIASNECGKNMKLDANRDVFHLAFSKDNHLKADRELHPLYTKMVVQSTLDKYPDIDINQKAMITENITKAESLNLFRTRLQEEPGLSIKISNSLIDKLNKSVNEKAQMIQILKSKLKDTQKQLSIKTKQLLNLSDYLKTKFGMSDKQITNLKNQSHKNVGNISKPKQPKL